MVESDPVFSREDEYFWSGPEKYRHYLGKFGHFRELLTTGQLAHLTPEERAIYEGVAIPYHGMSLHQAMFLPTIRGQADEEQLKKWLPLAENYDIIGCYAQTELGHGSNVRGLETTATFDPDTDEIVLHSPTLTSTKWWPGSLGKTANHAVLHARLLLPLRDQPGKVDDRGVHAFIVQIRDLQTHANMPGVNSGMIGPKYGTNQNDNGFLRLDHVRVPRRHMLSRYTKLERDGRYHLANQNASRLNYGTMLLIRSGIVVNAGRALSIATTIATRYSSVRRQFPAGEEAAEGGNGKAPAAAAGHQLEQKVLDYQSQQYRVLSNVATAYALLATGKFMREMFLSLQRGLQSDNFETLPEAHATSSGLKAITTMLAAEGIEECRKACGGHGYLLNSGMGELFTSYVSNNTLEGENYVIVQQLSRYLIKSFQGARAGKAPVGNAKYMLPISKQQYLTVTVARPEDLRATANQLNAFANRAGYLIAQVVKRVETQVAAGQSFTAAFQAVQWLGFRAARAHCMYTILVNFVNLTEQARQTDPELYPVLKPLCDLFALYNTERDLGEFLEASQYSPIQSGWIHEQVEALLREVRPNAVALVDAFNHSDRDLNSALGRHDGNVYEALFNWTKRDPLNKTDVIGSYQDVIRPIITKQYGKARL